MTSSADGDIGADRLGANADQLYSALMKLHEGLSDADSARLNARLVLLLINQVAQPETVLQVFDAARAGLD